MDLTEGRIVVLDFETTGFNPKWNRITEIGVCEIADGKILDKKNNPFSKVVNAGKSIPKEVTALTGITNEERKAAPPIEGVLRNFKNFIDGAVLVAQNADFDIRFLNEEFGRIGLVPNNTYVCTCESFRRFRKINGISTENDKLESIAKYFDIKQGSAHRAGDDAYVTAQAFLKMLELCPKALVTKKINQYSFLDYEEMFEKGVSFNDVIELKGVTDKTAAKYLINWLTEKTLPGYEGLIGEYLLEQKEFESRTDFSSVAMKLTEKVFQLKGIEYKKAEAPAKTSSWTTVPKDYEEKFEKGLSIDEIAKEFGQDYYKIEEKLVLWLTPDTMPLYKGVVDQLLIPEEKHKKIQELHETGNGRLKPIFEHFNGEYSYSAIRLTKKVIGL